MVQPNPDLAERKQAGPAAAVERTVSRGLEELMTTMHLGGVRAENPPSCLLWVLACTENTHGL